MFYNVFESLYRRPVPYNVDNFIRHREYRLHPLCNYDSGLCIGNNSCTPEYYHGKNASKNMDYVMELVKMHL